jgi:hypothetical protein
MAKRKKAETPQPTETDLQAATEVAHHEHAIEHFPEAEPVDPADLAPRSAEEPTAQVQTTSDPVPAKAERLGPQKPQGRPWTERYEQPVRYVRFTGKDDRGHRRIFVKFDLPAGEEKPHPDVLAVVQAHKRTEDDRPTGLRFTHDQVHGKTWSVPDDPLGRETADKLDMALNEVAHKIEREGHGAA